LIVVPTAVLQKQWKQEVIDVLGFAEEDIGFLGDGEKDIDKKCVIAIINSLRKIPVDKDLMILDEVHHYCSPENIKGIQKSKYKYFLGLTATLDRDDGLHEELMKFAKVIYTIDQEEAIDEGYNAPYDIINVGVNLGPTTRQKYDYYQDIINRNFGAFNHDYPLVKKEAFSGNIMAAVLFKAFNKRKTILNNSIEKVIKAVEVVEAYKDTDKIMVFNEIKKITDIVYKSLKKKEVSAGIMQSSHSKKQRQKIKEDFENNVFNVLVCCKVLDEGLNVKDTSIGIIVSGNSTRRQGIQRTGRALRPKEGKKAKLINIYVRDSQYEKWLRKRLSGLRGYDKMHWQ
jgi:superfamily II DNA or RNA helicase